MNFFGSDEKDPKFWAFVGIKNPDDLYYIDKKEREFYHKRTMKRVPTEFLDVDVMIKVKEFTSTEDIFGKITKTGIPKLDKAIEKKEGHKVKAKQNFDRLSRTYSNKKWDAFEQKVNQFTDKGSDVHKAILKEVGIKTKKEFREWAKSHHPDKGGDATFFRLVKQAVEESKLE